MSWLILLFACGGGGPAPDTSDPPTSQDTDDTDLPVCTADVDGTSTDCAAIEALWCDDRTGLLEAKTTCCDCADAFCSTTCDDPPPPDFPPDSGPELVFEGGLTGSLLPIPQSVWIGPDPEGVLRMTATDLHGIQPLTCTRTLNTLECADHTAHQVPFSLFDVRLTDADGDGVADGGLVRAMARIEGDDTATYATLEADTTGLNTGFADDPLVPTDPIEVQLREPVDPDSVPALLDGVGPWELWMANDDVAVGVRSLGIAEWGSSVSIDGLTDVSGNDISVVPAIVVDDPGLANDNLDFELDGVGWASTRGTLHTDQLAVPTSGTHAAGVWRDASIVGELQVPVDTPLLSFDWHQTVDGSSSDALLSFVVVTTEERTILWTQDTAQSTAVPNEWATVTVDLSAWAGQTVFVRFEVDASTPNTDDWAFFTWTVPPVPPPTLITFDTLRFEAAP